MCFLKYERIFVFACILSFFFFCGCCRKKENIKKEISITKNPYGFEDMENEMKTIKGFSVVEMEEALKSISGLTKVEGMDDIIATINGKKITRLEFHSQKITKELQYDISTKKIMYSLIRPIVIRSEAERLNLKPSQEDINKYISSLQHSLENEYVKAYMRAKNLTIEEYIKEQEKMAYDMFQGDALYQYAKTSSEYDNIEEYVNYLIKYADIKFYDSEIEKACLEE